MQQRPHPEAPDPAPHRSNRVVLVAGLLALAFAVGAFLPPLLEARAVEPAGWLRLLYAPVCHQLPDRCLAPGGLPAAACARCTGLYLGGALGLLAFGLLRVRVRRTWFFAAVAPTLADVAAPLLGLPGLSSLPRFVASVPTGAVLGLFLGVALADVVALAAERRRQRTTSPLVPRGPFPRSSPAIRKLAHETLESDTGGNR